MMGDVMTATDNDGLYNLSGTTGAAAATPVSANLLSPRLVGGAVEFSLDRSQAVSVSVHDVSGRLLRQVARGTLQAGIHSLPLGIGTAADALRLVRVKTAQGEAVLRMAAGRHARAGAAGGTVRTATVSKSLSVGMDTLIFTALGYQQLIMSIDTLEGVYDVTLQAAAPVPAVNGMRQLDSGTFMMGGLGTASPASPIHQVTLTRGFYIDTTEVTQERYLRVMGVSPPVQRGFSYDRQLPVESVTWFDAALFCNAQSRIDNLDTVYSYTSLTGVPGYGCSAMAGLVINHGRNGYRLPTEAQWEYACRAGTTGDYFWGPADSAGAYLWYRDNSGDMSHPVAQKRPNPFGLYDMNGNVWEWSNDWWSYYADSAQVDPTGPVTNGAQRTRTVRGGSQDNDTTNITSHMRQMWFNPETRFMTIGFRTVRPL
jgi:formylglycine-generating enzyme required for sulfatase activity